MNQLFLKELFSCELEAFVAAWFGIPFSWGMYAVPLGNPYRVFFRVPNTQRRRVVLSKTNLESDSYLPTSSHYLWYWSIFLFYTNLIVFASM
jgi:hypothetical protein